MSEHWIYSSFNNFKLNNAISENELSYIIVRRAYLHLSREESLVLIATYDNGEYKDDF